MLKFNIKKIISLIIIFLVVGVGCTVFATEESVGDDWFDQYQFYQGNGTIDETGDVEQIPEGIVDTELVDDDEESVDDEEESVDDDEESVDDELEKRPATTPHAGLEDYTGLIFVVIFTVSAVYAYKKVKEYNG